METEYKLADVFDRFGVECGNCSAKLIVAGGSLGEHHGLTVSEGEEESICGYCAGMELTTLRAESEALRVRAEAAERQSKHMTTLYYNLSTIAGEIEAERNALRVIVKKEYVAQTAAAEAERDAAISEVRELKEKLDETRAELTKWIQVYGNV